VAETIEDTPRGMLILQQRKMLPLLWDFYRFFGAEWAVKFVKKPIVAAFELDWEKSKQVLVH